MNLKNFEECLDLIFKKYKMPGFDCIVYKDHEMLGRYKKGTSDIETGRPIDGTELYFIFSMTKMLTCTAALQIFEKGGFLMSDPISKYIPEFEKMKISEESLDTASAAKITTGGTDGEAGSADSDGYAKRQITVRDLFTMSGGLDYALSDEAIQKALDAGKKTTLEIVKAMADKTLGFEPGTRFRYSLCHDVLGALIEVWTGKTLGEYMKENIFEPLGMKYTFFGLTKDETLLSRMAGRHNYDKGGNPEKVPLECIYCITHEYESGGAGLTSCTEDYALFLDALACGGMGRNGNRILSPVAVELMGTNHLKGQAYEDFQVLRPGYGYGLGVRTHTDKTVSGSLSPIGEFGWDGAAGGFAMVDTKNKLSLTFLQHIHNWNINFQTEIRNALYSCLD